MRCIAGFNLLLEESGCCFQLENYYMTDVLPTYINFMIALKLRDVLIILHIVYTIDFHLLRSQSIDRFANIPFRILHCSFVDCLITKKL